MITIADISANHDGDINKAKQLIYEAKECGVSIAKFQHWTTEKFINKKIFDSLPKSAHQKNWKSSVYDAYKKYELPLDWIPQLADYAKSIGIGFAVTCYDIDLIDEIDKYNCLSKIGSGEITNPNLLAKTARKGKLTLLGTGASNINEVIMAVGILQSINPQIVLMQCNTNYLTEKDKVNYSCINVLKSYKCYFPDFDLGLSDHSKDIYPVILAQSLGAKFIERHFKGTLNTESPDADFSLTSIEWKFMQSEIKKTMGILGNTYKEIQRNETESVRVQRRALYATKDLKPGHVITSQDVIAMRPCLDGMLTPWFNLEGIKTKKEIKKHEPFLLDNIEIKAGK